MMNVSGNALTSSRRAIGNPTRERGTAFPFANVPRSRALMLRFFSPEGGITSAVAARPRFLGDFTTEPGGRHNSAVAVATVSPSGLFGRKANKNRDINESATSKLTRRVTSSRGISPTPKPWIHTHGDDYRDGAGVGIDVDSLGRHVAVQRIADSRA